MRMRLMQLKVGDLIRYKDDAQWFGVIIEIDSSSTRGSFQVLWNDGDLSWVGAWKVEAYDESR